MLSARLHRYGERLRLEEVEEPKILDPHDVIVRVGGAGVCRTDLHIVQGLLAPYRKPDLPYILGHETAGWVATAGGSVTSVAVGDAVIVHPSATCGVCEGCRRGRDMYCTRSRSPGLTADGGFAEYLRTNERALVPLPDGLEPAAVAPYADAGLAAYHAVRKAARTLEPGDTAVVIGIGGLGHLAVQMLHALCAATVVAVDTSEAALDVAHDVGADHVVRGGEDAVGAVLEVSKGGAPAVLDFVGEGRVPAQVLSMLAKGGTYYAVGYGGRLETPLVELVAREISVVANLVGTYTELAELVKLAASGRVRLETRRIRLEDVNGILEALETGGVKGRAVIVPS